MAALSPAHLLLRPTHGVPNRKKQDVSRCTEATSDASSPKRQVSHAREASATRATVKLAIGFERITEATEAVDELGKQKESVSACGLHGEPRQPYWLGDATAVTCARPNL